MTTECFAERAGKACFLGRALAHTQFPGMAGRGFGSRRHDICDFRNAANFHDALTTPALVRAGPPSPYGIGITAVAWLE